MEGFNQRLLLFAVILLSAVLLIAAGTYIYFYKKQHFVCPKCGHCFKPKVLKMIFSMNVPGGKIIKCPNCGEKEFMEPVKDDGFR